MYEYERKLYFPFIKKICEPSNIELTQENKKQKIPSSTNFLLKQYVINNKYIYEIYAQYTLL